LRGLHGGSYFKPIAEVFFEANQLIRDPQYD
jgi:hypothetical protein